MSDLPPVHDACTDCGRRFDTGAARHCPAAASRGCPWCVHCFRASLAGERRRRPGAEAA